MIIYYGVIGTSKFGIDDTGSGLWDGWIVMSGPRPDVDYYASENGEWLPDPSPQEIQLMIAEAVTKKALSLSQASDMIGALTDEIEGLEDAGETVPEKLRDDLKAWKQYRIALKNVDVSIAPDIEWPVSPEAALAEV